MSDVISEYQQWKQQGEGLRTKAKQAMEARFRELFSEAIKIAEEYRADFGGTLRPPPSITAFRYKASAKKAAKAKTAAPSDRPAPKVELPPAKPDPKVARLQKRLAEAKKKLESAKSGGAPTRTLEDKVYELEDDLRLASNPE